MLVWLTWFAAILKSFLSVQLLRHVGFHKHIPCVLIFHCLMWYLKKYIIKIASIPRKNLTWKQIKWLNKFSEVSRLMRVTLCPSLKHLPFTCCGHRLCGDVKGRLRAICSEHFLSGRQACQTSVQCRKDLSMPRRPAPHLMVLLLFRLLTGRAPLKLVIPGRKRQMRWCLAKGYFKGNF